MENENLKTLIELKHKKLMEKVDACLEKYVELECNSVEFEEVYKEFQYRLSMMSDNFYSDIFDEANVVLEKAEKIQQESVPYEELDDYAIEMQGKYFCMRA